MDGWPVAILNITALGMNFIRNTYYTSVAGNCLFVQCFNVSQGVVESQIKSVHKSPRSVDVWYVILLCGSSSMVGMLQVTFHGHQSKYVEV